MKWVMKLDFYMYGYPKKQSTDSYIYIGFAQVCSIVPKLYTPK